MLREHGPYVFAHPRRVVVPVKTMGTGWGFFRRESNNGYESPVPVIVSQVRELLRPTRDDFHLVTIAGMFWDKEVEQLKRQCEALGNVHVRVNLMKPWLSQDRRFADFLVCDFTVPSYVPWALVDLFDTTAQERYRHGITWDELREMAAHVPEKDAAILIRDELKRLWEGRRR